MRANSNPPVAITNHVASRVTGVSSAKLAATAVRTMPNSSVQKNRSVMHHHNKEAA